MKFLICVWILAAALPLPTAARADEPASDLAERFAHACMSDPSPAKSANDAANEGKWEVDKGLTGVDSPSPSHIVTTQTWHAGHIGKSEISVVSTNVDSGKCRVQACGVTADHFPEQGLEAALTKRLGLPAPASHSEDNVAIQAAWPLPTPVGRVISLAAQKSLTGTRVTLTVALLCPQT